MGLGFVETNDDPCVRALRTFLLALHACNRLMTARRIPLGFVMDRMHVYITCSHSVEKAVRVVCPYCMSCNSAHV